MSVNIKIEKGHVFFLGLLIILVGGILFVQAQGNGVPNPGHGDDSIYISSLQKTLKQAIKNGDIITKEKIEAEVESVNGCESNVCAYVINFAAPFTTVPVVVCSAGPNSNPGWIPLHCIIQSIEKNRVRIALDTGNPDLKISGVKSVYIIAAAPNI